MTSYLLADEAGSKRLSVSRYDRERDPQHLVTFFIGDLTPIQVEEWYQLYCREPVFRKMVNHCAAVVQPYLDRPFLGVLFPQLLDADEFVDERNAVHRHLSNLPAARLDEVAYSQPASFILGYAWTALWKSWEIEPDLIIGHNVGEYVAACCGGVLAVEEWLKLLAVRSQLLPLLQIDDRHAVDDFAQIAASLNFQAPRLPLISTLTRRNVNGEVTLPAYWVHHGCHAGADTPPLQWVHRKKRGILIVADPHPEKQRLMGQGYAT